MLPKTDGEFDGGSKAKAEGGRCGGESSRLIGANAVPDNGEGLCPDRDGGKDVLPFPNMLVKPSSSCPLLAPLVL